MTNANINQRSKVFLHLCKVAKTPITYHDGINLYQSKRLINAAPSEHQEKNEEILTNKEAHTLKDMSFSKTWAFNWLTKNNYYSRRLHGEAADVNRAGVTDGTAHLQEVINDL